jgi:hypothetical protein
MVSSMNIASDFFYIQFEFLLSLTSFIFAKLELPVNVVRISATLEIIEDEAYHFCVVYAKLYSLMGSLRFAVTSY